MRKPTFAFVTGPVFLMFLLAAAAAAQTGTIKGKVRNMRGDAVSGVVVTARQESRDVRSTRSDPKGEFSISGLDAGTYNVAFDAKGYSTGVKFGVEIKGGQTVDLGDRLILQVDRGTQVIIQGSVFYKNGTSVTAAEVKVEKIYPDGSTKKLGTLMTNISGEFSLRQPEGAARFRFTVKYKGESVSKELEVDSPAIYRLALNLPIDREK